MFEFLPKTGGACSTCCQKCLYWWSDRCPYGKCFDDFRARYWPREKVTGEHKTGWSDCEKPGEQNHWCRGGLFYNIDPEKVCESFVEYEGQIVQSCLKANVSIFQDGYISCSLIDAYGCKYCYEEFERSLEG